MAKTTKTRAKASNRAKSRDPKELKDLVPDRQNARRHTERNLTMIDESLALVGAGRSVVIDEGGRLLAGNATASRAQARGMKLKVVDTDADTIIAVRRRGLTEEHKTALALYDNRTAELAQWDPAMLQALADAGTTMAPFWTDGQFKQLLEALDEENPGLTDPDALPKMRATTIATGDLFQLGGHRLLCGDSTSPEAVTRLMDGHRAQLFATDPPYLVDYSATADKRKTKARKDTETADWDDASQGMAFFVAYLEVAKTVAIDPNAAWYGWHASRRQRWMEEAWEQTGAFVHQQIIWVKTRAVFGHSVYLWRHEPCFFGWLRGKKPHVRLAALADGHPTTVWIDRRPSPSGEIPTTTWFIPSTEVETSEHPTSKPVRVFTIPMLMHTHREAICYEPFCGSGSQIIGGEQTGRRVFAMEREPAYCQLSIDRWEAFTGKKARLLKRGTPMKGSPPHGKRKGRAA